MATLVSPGVDVQILNESFYSSAGPGTVPLIVMATAANKASPTGTGIAPFTAPQNAGQLFIATSQRELIQAFGNPKFYSEQGTAIHGHELNEYGLHAAYSFLGISNRCFVMRADIDLAQLEPSDSAPTAPPLSGTYWLDLSETSWGVFQSNGNSNAASAWEAQPVKLAMGSNVVTSGSDLVPANSFGNDGDFAVMPLTADNLVYEKIYGAWHKVGSTTWKAARPTVVSGSVSPTAVAVNSAIRINGAIVDFNSGTTAADVVSAINSVAQSAPIANVSATLVNGAVTITNAAGTNLTIVNEIGTPLSNLGITSGLHKGVTAIITNSANYPDSISGDVWIKGTKPNSGANMVIKRYDANVGAWITLSAPFYPYNPTLNDGDASKDEAAISALGTPVAGTVYVAFDSSRGIRELRRYSGSRWESLIYEADLTPPSVDPEEGTYWYNTDFRCDMLVADGDQWIAYRRRFPTTDPKGVIIAGSAPLTQTDGTPLVSNDIWLDSSDLENYPKLHRYDETILRWRAVDNTDQTTPAGIVFADARADSGPAFTGMPNANGYTHNSENITDMLVSDYLDPDAPDPRVYPDGVLLFNTRYSTYNVKAWRPNYFEAGNYDPNTDYGNNTYTVGSAGYTFPALAKTGRWVTASGNKTDGSPYMGRKAQRIMVVRSMVAAVQSNEDLRSEIIYYNLMAAPGYPELIDDLQSLNVDQKEISFLVADTPIRMSPAGAEIMSWATNKKNASSNGEDGLTSQSIYTAVYYPWGMSGNIDGMDVMVPPSTIALRTYAYNDQVSYPWFAPAGFQRGLVSNASSVGYLSKEGEFKAVILNQGQRDVLYTHKINPIAYIPNRGLVIYGQKTLSALESALDRVNVARLANYIKYQLDIILKPFLFEQNDEQTRDAAKATVERFFNGLVGLRALEDYAVQCDVSNNSAERRNRNELWIDVLIRPIKAIEFIYVPVRIRPSADDASLQF